MDLPQCLQSTADLLLSQCRTLFWGCVSGDRSPIHGSAQAAVVRCRLHPLPVAPAVLIVVGRGHPRHALRPALLLEAHRLVPPQQKSQSDPQSLELVSGGWGFTISCPSEDVTSAGQRSLMFGPVATSSAGGSPGCFTSAEKLSP
ncbi:unnamed protein product, partial [Staurois parvus]